MKRPIMLSINASDLRTVMLESRRCMHLPALCGFFATGHTTYGGEVGPASLYFCDEHRSFLVKIAFKDLPAAAAARRINAAIAWGHKMRGQDIVIDGKDGIE